MVLCLFLTIKDIRQIATVMTAKRTINSDTRIPVTIQTVVCVMAFLAVLLVSGIFSVNCIVVLFTSLKGVVSVYVTMFTVYVRIREKG